MIIEKCILSCNKNSLYLDFWPIVSKVWKMRFNIDPVLIFLGEPEKLDNTSGSIIYQPLIEDVPEDIQCLWSRYYYTSMFTNDVCITSDIDMFPISHFYFRKQLEPFSSDSYLHLYSNSGRDMLPSCYHVALGTTFKTFLELPDTFEESLQKVLEFGYDIYKSSASYWYVDEIYATYLLKGKSVVYVERPENSRLDRSYWKRHTKLELEKYIDCHSLRPYIFHKDEIDYLVENLSEAYNGFPS